jgi:hypothetical protein
MKQLFTILFLAFSVNAWSQNFEFRQKNDVKVIIGTDTLKNAWAGGLNAPVFSKLDLNGDNVEDLFVFDRNIRKISTFLAVNKAGTWQWKYAPDYENIFPAGLENWALLVDFDQDGDKDLFTQSNLGIYLYRNQKAPGGGNVYAAPYRLRFDTFANLNNGAYVLPAFTDLDRDGDTDILVFNGSGANIEYYKNLTLETYGIKDSLKLTRSLDTWGDITRCSGSCNLIQFAGNTCRVSSPSGVNHGGGASILALDMDNDLDKDIIFGADMCANLQSLRNDALPSSPATAIMVPNGLNTTYPAGANPANIVNYPAAYYEDINFDSKRDLLVAPFLIDNSDNPDFKQSSWTYLNTAASATAVPVFTFQKKNFLQDEMVEMDVLAAPVLEDIDLDGDLDMLVSSSADYRNGAVASSVIHLYRNVGTRTNPIYKLENSDYLNLSASNIRGVKLQFGDINGDGKKDLLLNYNDASGGATGNLGYIPNHATSATVPYAYSRANFTQINIAQNATDEFSYFYDVDNDGDLDIIRGTLQQISATSGGIWYYKRVGADLTQFSSWQLENNRVGDIPRSNLSVSLQPSIADLNNDNLPDLLTMSSAGVLTIYPNFLANLNGTMTGNSTVVYNTVQNTLVSTRLGKYPFVIAGDLDGDFKNDILVGSNAGGLTYFKNQTVTLGMKEDQLVAALKLNVYPNPANDQLTIFAAEKIQFSVFDAAGKEVIPNTSDFKTTHQVNTSNLKPGMYFLKFATEDFRSAGRTFIIQR